MVKHTLSIMEKMVIIETAITHGIKICDIVGSAVVFLSNSDLEVEEAWELYKSCLEEEGLGYLLNTKLN